ncbi:MAG: TldD/PmbA family protein, partial [Bacteroidetes bacterium]|nr:TldD/PmbA family protein [Bacteroidota bacterium]
MKRRDFLYNSGLGIGSLLLPGSSLFANQVPLDKPWSTIDTADKKRMADIALNAARGKGATYSDVRI